MLRNCMGIINMEESEKDIRNLTTYRPIATIPFAGRYRVIDFILSGMVNSGIKNISVFSKKETRSLADHLGNGKPWDLDRKSGGLYLFNHNLLGGNAIKDVKHFSNNIAFFKNNDADTVVFSSSYMILNIDIEKYVSLHKKSNADISVIYQKSDDAEREFLNCDSLIISNENRVIGISKNIGIVKSANISTEIFIMSKNILLELLYEGLSKGIRSDFKVLIKNNLFKYNVIAHEFSGFLKCINSTNSYYNASMNMLDSACSLDLFNTKLPIYTKTGDSPPVKYLSGCDIKKSLIADGSVLSGKIRNSIINRNVKIEEDVILEGCIILQNATIKKGARLKNVIVDKGVVVSENAIIECPKNHPLVFEKNIAV